MWWRLPGLVLLWLLGCATLVERARADGAGLTLARLSQGECASTLAREAPLTLVRGDGTPTLAADGEAFRRLVAQLAPSVAPAELAPVVTSGPVGFDLALETSVSAIARDQVWARATSGDDPLTCDGRGRQPASVLVTNRVRLAKGLPWGFTLGGEAGWVHGTRLGLFGVDVKFALLEDVWGARVPDFALRAGLTRVVSGSELDLWLAALSAVVSEAWVAARTLVISPFVGASLWWTRARSETVDLTPNIDARGCLDGSDLVCRAAGLAGSGADLAHDVRFGRVSLLRVRAFLGLSLRFRRASLAASFALDPARPRAGDHLAGPVLPRQWRVSLAPAVSF